MLSLFNPAWRCLLFGGICFGTTLSIRVAAEPALLEDYSTLRLNGDLTPLWAPYLGEDSNQTGAIENGRYRVDVGAGNGVYFHFFPRHGGYAFPQGYAQHYIKSGAWNPAYNRLRFWVRTSQNIARRADGGSRLEFGTYARAQATIDASSQGRHFYHVMDPNFYADRWMLIEINRVPQHEVGQNPNLNWPENPTAPEVNYFDGLTRMYFDSQGIGFENSTWWFDDFQFDHVAGEPESLVSSLTAVHTGTRYEVTWAGPKNITQHYEVRYAAQSMKTLGFSAGIDGGTVSNPGNTYTGTLWQSPLMAEATSGLYIAIRPVGETMFREIYLPNMASHAPIAPSNAILTITVE